MGRTEAAVRRADGFDLAVGAALVLLAAASLALAVRLGGAAGGGEEVLVGLRAQVEKRILTERGQIRALLDAAARGDRAAVRRGAEAALPRLADNSQLHLLLAGELRAEGLDAPALREYRRAVELTRDYADRRSPYSVVRELKPWLAAAKARLEDAGPASGPALADLHFLERSLAGGCS